MPSAKDSLKAKVAAFKAKVEQNSISPSYLGEILDDMIEEHDALQPSHITIAGAPDSIAISVGTDDNSVTGRIPAASDTYAGAMSAAMKRKLDKAAEYIEFDGIADRVAALKMSVSFGSDHDGYKVVFVRKLNTFLLCYGIPDPYDDEASGYNNWADADDFGAFSENGRVPYPKTLYLDRSSDILYKLADNGQLVQLGSRFSSLSLDTSDKRYHIVKALDVSGATIASVSIPKPAKAPESPVKILAKGICRPTSDPRFAYRLHYNPGPTVIYKLPDKQASEQLRQEYTSEYGPDITVFNVSHLLNFDGPEYDNSYFWVADDMRKVNTVLKKILTGWEKDHVCVSPETYTEDSAPAGWTPVWTHHLIILNRYDYPHRASYMLMVKKNVGIPDNVYIFRDSDGRLKQTYNVVLQQFDSASDNIKLSVRFTQEGDITYGINGNNVSAVGWKNGKSYIKKKKQLRRTCKYEIQWCRRRSGKHAWDHDAFSDAIINGEGRDVAFLKARAVGYIEHEGYLSYNKWITHAIPKRCGVVRIRKRATETAPAGQWNYFIVRNLDMEGAGYAWVRKIGTNVKKLRLVFMEKKET